MNVLTTGETKMLAEPAPQPRPSFEQAVCWMNGRLMPAAEATVSVFDHGLLYGDGVIEGGLKTLTVELYGFLKAFTFLSEAWRYSVTELPS